MLRKLTPKLTPVRIFTAAAAVLVIGLFVACGGDDLQSGDTATAAATTPPTAVPASAPAAPATPATESPTGSATVLPSPTSSAPPAELAATPSPAPEPTSAPMPASHNPPPMDAASIEGLWDGITTVAAIGELPFAVTIVLSEIGFEVNLDIPAQNAYGLATSNVTFESGRLHFELESPIGLAIWDGELLDGVIKGEFQQGDVGGTFLLQRTEKEEAQTPASQEAETAYRREEVTLSNGRITLAGDLTLPDSAAPFPAVVLISGSGGQDRDANFYGFRVFDVLANLIAAQGIAVLRFDDRGIGGSNGDWLQATLDDRASDVAAAMAWLQAREDIDHYRIGLVGHSEGGLVAGIAANQVEGIAYLALLAFPAVRGDELLRAQQKMILEVGGASRELVEQAQAYQRLALRAVATGEGWDAVESSARTLFLAQLGALPEAAQGSIANTEKYVDGMVARQLMLLQSPWFRSFVEYDPRPDILALDVPVLALFGTHDTQVPADQNSTAMSEAFGESSIPSHALATIWPANHLFQEAETGAVEEYAVLKPEFALDFLQFLLDWLAVQTASP